MKNILYPALTLLGIFAAMSPAGAQTSAIGGNITAGAPSSAWTASSRPDISYRQSATPNPAYAKQPGAGSAKIIRDKQDVNFTSYNTISYNKSAEALAANRGYENDPELGVLYSNAPCSSCYEVLEKRTARQKYFVKEGTDGKKFVIQSSSEPVHYQDGSGHWRSIGNQLEPVNSAPGVYSTTGRQLNVLVNTQAGYVSMTNQEGTLNYNRDLELIYVKPDGSQVSLGKADWKHHTTGASGMKVTNVWAGIDMELYVSSNSVKTNFVLNHALPAYAAGKLLIRDHMQAGGGLTIEQKDGSAFAGALSVLNAGGEPAFQAQKANAYELNNATTTTQDLNYIVSGNGLDLEVPGSLCNRATSSYPLVIDPLVTGTVPSTGFVYSPSGSSYCVVPNAVTLPAAAVVTDVIITYGYTAVAGTHYYEVDSRFSINYACLTPRISCPTWTGTGIGGSGSQCLMSGFSFFGGSGLGASWEMPGCMPAFSCFAQTVTFNIHSSQFHSSAPSCSQTVVATQTPFTVNVEGTAGGSASITPAGPSSFCVGSSNTLTGSPSGGTWTSSNPSIASVSGSGVVNSVALGTATITYTPPGSCGYYATTTVTNVNAATVSPVTGPTSVCEGSTITMADATPGGTWTSADASIATVSAGVVSGISAGTTTITYSVSNACGTVNALRNVTVNPLPAIGPITGTAGICIGATVPYTDPVTGGTWSSSTPAVATVSGTGSVHGVTAGTSTITYTTTNTWCTARATQVVTVSIAPVVSPITGPTTVCEGHAVVLANASPGGIWSSADTLTAPIDSMTGRMAGAWNGTTMISYTVSSACATVTSTVAVTVGLVAEYHNTISTIVGDGTSGSSGDGGPASAAEITSIFGMTYDAAGNLYFVDAFNEVVRKVDPSGTVTLFAGYYGSPAMSAGDGGPAVSASLWGPSGIAADAAGNVYIGEYYSGLIRVVAPSGIINTIANLAPANIRELSIDGSGNIYATDETHAKVFKITSGGTVSIFAGTGTSGYSGDGGLASLAMLDTPTGVAADRFGNVYIADNGNQRVRKVNSAGIITTVGGTGIPGYSGDLGPATAANMNPECLTTDTLGNVYVGEYANSTVRKINATDHIISRVCGTGDPVYAGDGMLALSANISPNSIVMDPAGFLTIGEYGNFRIRKLVNYLSGGIIGSSSICMGTTSTYASTFADGTWSSSNTAVATINATTGVLTPVTPGVTTVKYKIVSTCDSAFTTMTVTVNPLPAPGTVTGPSVVCAGASISLTDAATGGTWVSAAPGVATVDGSGNVVGVTAGTVTISYLVTNSCGSLAATQEVTVNPAPDAGTITGASSVMCLDSTLSLTDVATGGTWGSVNGNVTVAGGVVSAVAMGLDTVTYSVTNSCGTAVSKYPVQINGCNVGVGKLLKGSGNLQLFPNPNGGKFTLALFTDLNEQAEVVIRNVVGEQIRQFTMITNKDNEVIMKVASGIYFVTASTAHKTYTAKLTITE